MTRLGSADGRESPTATQGPKGRKEAQWDTEGSSSQALAPAPREAQDDESLLFKGSSACGSHREQEAGDREKEKW